MNDKPSTSRAITASDDLTFPEETVEPIQSGSNNIGNLVQTAVETIHETNNQLLTVQENATVSANSSPARRSPAKRSPIRTRRPSSRRDTFHGHFTSELLSVLNESLRIRDDQSSQINESSFSSYLDSESMNMANLLDSARTSPSTMPSALIEDYDPTPPPDSYPVYYKSATESREASVIIDFFSIMEESEEEDEVTLECDDAELKKNGEPKEATPN